MTRTGARGHLVIDDPALATQQLLGLIRGDMQIRCLLDPEWRLAVNELRRHIDAAITVFLKSYAPLP